MLRRQKRRERAPGFAPALTERLRQRSRIVRWRNNPVEWADERLGEELWSIQGDIMLSVRDNPRTAVQSCHGVGKSHIASRVVLWMLDTHDPGDIFAVTTAPTAAQVRAILWRYIRQGHAKADLPGRVGENAEWKIDGPGLVAYGRKPADHDESAFQGIHAPVGVLVVIDEACGVPKQLWVASDSLVTTEDSRILAIGNPDDAASHFAQVCTTEPGWNRIRIGAFDTPNLTGEKVHPKLARALVQKSWVEDKKTRWGEANPLYKAKVLGEFADSDDGLIPLSWVRAANQRWNEWREKGSIPPAGRRVIGVDVARFGTDETALAIRQGYVIMDVLKYAKFDTVETTALVQGQLSGNPKALAVVDAVGVGAGVVDQLRHDRKNVIPFEAGAGTGFRDRTGVWGFPNLRSAAWWNLRELLDPANDPTLALPDNDDLTADLTTPKYRPAPGSKIVVEDKDSIRKRLGRSTDSGDAVVQAMWVEHSSNSANQPATRPKAIAYSSGVTFG